MRLLTAAFIALWLVAGASAAPSEDEIRQAEKAWAAAVTRTDAEALERILDDQLIYAHSTGVVESKAEYLERLRRGAQKYELIEHQRITVKLHGDAAVAHCHVRMKGMSDQVPFDNRLMMLHLWVKRAGQWRLVAHQTTELR